MPHKCDLGLVISRTSAMQTLEEIKAGSRAETYAKQLLDAEVALNDNRCRALRDFIVSSLHEDTRERAEDIHSLLEILDPAM